MYPQKKIKVLECIRQGLIGGGESHLLVLVENLDRSRIEPVVLSFTDGPMIEQLKKMGVKTYIIPTTKPFNFMKWRAVKKILRTEQIDIVHAHGTRANSNIIWAARSLRIPVVYTIHGWSFHQDQNKFVHKLRVLSEGYLTRRTNLNISVSEANQLEGKEKIPSFSSTIINYGIDQEKFNPLQQFPDIREQLGIEQDVLLVLFLARFTFHKQPLSLIEAFSKALPYNPKMKLLMVGDGDQKKDAMQLIKKLGITENVQLEPFRQDVPAVLACADIYVLPSLWEGLPIGLIEALAMGKAIIASKVDGTKNILIDNENGIMVETANLVENLTNAIIKLSQDDQLRKKLGNNARETVQEKYTSDKMTRIIENIYEKLLA